MGKFLIAIAAFAALLGMSLLFYVRREPEPFDGGGSVMKYYRKFQADSHSSQPMVITGTCGSSFTMKLGIKRICIDPNATLMFHQATLFGVRSEYGTKILMSTYPKNIQNWVSQNGALTRNELTRMTVREAISMGIRSCVGS
jgi:hypothetical protein